MSGAKLAGLILSILSIALAFRLWPFIRLYESRDTYVSYARACLTAHRSEQQALDIAGTLAPEARDRLMAAVEVERVSCDRLQLLRFELQAAGVSRAELKKIDYAVLLDARTPLGSRVRDLDR